MSERIDILFPPGRLVAGSVSDGRTTDSDGRPLITKSGANTGQPRVEYSFGVAIPKAGEQHWNQTAWGAKIWQVAQAAFPQGQYQSPNFSWKIADGDSAVPNTRGIAPNAREGYPGNWVVYFSSGIAPKTVNHDGSQPVDPAEIKRGFFVEVYGNVAGNGEIQRPGIYINHSIVALNSYGPIIHSGPDASAVGFGSAVAAGGSQTPPAGFVPPAQTPPPAQPAQMPAAQMPPAQPAQMPAAQVPPVQPAQMPPAQVPPAAVQPDHSFVQNAAAAPAPTPAVRQFSVNGQVYTEAQLIAGGWTPEQIAANATPV